MSSSPKGDVAASGAFPAKNTACACKSAETFDIQTRHSFPARLPLPPKAFALGRQEKRAELQLPWAASVSVAGLPFRSVCTAQSTAEAAEVPL